LVAQFPPKWAAFTVTDPSGHCSCDLFRSQSQGFDEERERERYRAKGWSEAKIARAVAGRRPKRTRYDHFVELLTQLVQSCGQIAICTVDGHGVDVPVFPRTALGLHEYLAGNGKYPHSTVVSIRASHGGS
jgi:hypothetical protein